MRIPFWATMAALWISFGQFDHHGWIYVTRVLRVEEKIRPERGSSMGIRHVPGTDNRNVLQHRISRRRPGNSLSAEDSRRFSSTTAASDLSTTNQSVWKCSVYGRLRWSEKGLHRQPHGIQHHSRALRWVKEGVLAHWNGLYWEAIETEDAPRWGYLRWR
jgi:hypothetical protein